jgi:hypothetical protein
VKKLFKNKETFNQLLIFTSLVFQFFFKELNINMDISKSNSYMEFILGQIFQKLNEIEVEEI